MGIPEFVYTVILKPKPLRIAANWLIRQTLPSRLRYRGLLLAINPADPVISGALRFGVYENDEVDLFQRILKPGMTVVDVGANVGLYSALAARAVGPQGRIVSFEPDAESFGFLLQTIECNGFANVEALRVAASSRAGAARLYRNPDNRGDSRLYDDPLLKDSVEITTIPLDDALSERRLAAIDVLKIDAQGAEGLVLQGAQRTLLSSEGLTIMMEFWPYGLSKTGFDPKAVLTGLAEKGFTLYDAGRGGVPLPTERDIDETVAKLVGRRYTNILATKRPDINFEASGRYD